MTGVALCAPRLAEDLYAGWLDLSDDQVAIFKTLERQARAMPKARRLQVLRPFGFSVYCAYCQEVVADVVDHVVPIARLGDSRIENLAPACGDCNGRKGARRRFRAPEYSNTEAMTIADHWPVVWPVWNMGDPQRFRLALDGD